MSSVIRSVKNVTKGYSSVQVKVRNGMAIYDSKVDSEGMTVRLTVDNSNE